MQGSAAHKTNTANDRSLQNGGSCGHVSNLTVTEKTIVDSEGYGY